MSRKIRAVASPFMATSFSRFPLHHKGAVAIDVNMVRAMVSLPSDEDKAASPNAHSTNVTSGGNT
jgi:hypothetical protein